MALGSAGQGVGVSFKWLWVLVGVCACRGSAEPCAAVVAPAGGSAGHQAREVPTRGTGAADGTPGPVGGTKGAGEPSVLAFDCRVDLETKEGERLRANDGPGPEGAKWNWFGPLVCWVHVGSCDEPTQAFVEVATLPRTAADTVERTSDGWMLTFRLPADAWIGAADKLAGPDAPYTTVPLVATVRAVCAEEERVLRDSFVGLVAFGE